MKKYIVVDTWNGDGYSYENGVDTKFFNDRNKAFQWAYKRALSNSNEELNDVHQYSDEEYFEEKAYSNGDGYYFETYNDNCGSYQVWETKDIYAIMIQCNVNTISMLTKKEYDEQIEQLEWEIEEYLKENKGNPYAVTDIEDLKDTDEDGDSFYHNFDDYDYQFRLIKNLK